MRNFKILFKKREKKKNIKKKKLKKKIINRLALILYYKRKIYFTMLRKIV